MTSGTVVATLGESLGIVRTDEVGPLETVHSARLSTGGSEANVAIGLARSGLEVRWLGRVGDDSFGRRIVRDLRSEGVDVRAVTDPSPTALLLKETPQPGRTRITYYRSDLAGSHLQPDDLTRLDLSTATLLHITGITPALSATARQAVFAAVEEARAAGATISFDVNYRSRLWSPADAKPTLTALARQSDIVLASSQEIPLIVRQRGDGTVEAAQQLHQYGVTEVVITNGDADSIASVINPNGDVAVACKTAHAITPVDTVGAGDAFTAAYLAARARGNTTQERLQAATSAGAAVCLHPGDWEAFPITSDTSTDQYDPVQR